MLIGLLDSAFMALISLEDSDITRNLLPFLRNLWTIYQAQRWYLSRETRRKEQTRFSLTTPRISKSMRGHSTLKTLTENFFSDDKQVSFIIELIMVCYIRKQISSCPKRSRNIFDHIVDILELLGHIIRKFNLELFFDQDCQLYIIHIIEFKFPKLSVQVHLLHILSAIEMGNNSWNPPGNFVGVKIISWINWLKYLISDFWWRQPDNRSHDDVLHRSDIEWGWWVCLSWIFLPNLSTFVLISYLISK